MSSDTCAPLSAEACPFAKACVFAETQAVEECNNLWKEFGVSTSFMRDFPDGITWDCGTCQGANLTSDRKYKCLTCNGYPPDHLECEGVAFSQLFNSVPEAMWFMVVTVTTVGYGDASPTTWGGKLFVCLVIFCGVIFLAMPLATMGNSFQTAWDERQLIKLQSHVRQLCVENGRPSNDARYVFQLIDINKTREISFKEFSRFLRVHLQFEVSKPEALQLWGSLDVDHSGALSFAEFVHIVFPDLMDDATFDMNYDVDVEQKESPASEGNEEVVRRLDLLEKKMASIESLLMQLPQRIRTAERHEELDGNDSPLAMHAKSLTPRRARRRISSTKSERGPVEDALARVTVKSVDGEAAVVSRVQSVVLMERSSAASLIGHRGQGGPHLGGGARRVQSETVSAQPVDYDEPNNGSPDLRA